MMRLLAALAVVLVVCLVTVAPMAMPAAADTAVPPFFSPTPRGYVGDSVGIFGTLADYAGQVVYFYYGVSDAEWELLGSQLLEGEGSLQLTFVVPKSSRGTHQVRICSTADPLASVIHLMTFTVLPMVEITSPADARGSLGTSVMLKGTGFTELEDSIKILFNGDVISPEEIEADRYGTWTGSFVVPAATRGQHDVSAEGRYTPARNVKKDVFTVEPGLLLDIAEGSPGDTIDMTGSGFDAYERQIKILFDGEELVTGIRADDTGYWQESFQVPEVPRGTYTVTADGDPTGQEDIDAINFEVRPSLLLSPDEGHVGMNLTVIGRGFEPNAEVELLYDDIEVPAANTDDKGSFEVTFEVPESRHGARSITAEDSAENEATAVFTMESDPPETPEPISPRDEGRAGFVGRVRPRFEWSEVSDPSGVYYRLQISASGNVTDRGDFADPLVSTGLLDEASYTLQKDEGLSYGNYYWIVQAVDGAENESEWTEPHSFRAGLLPMWAFIVIIVAVVLLGGGLVYFFAVRRRMYL